MAKRKSIVTTKESPVRVVEGATALEVQVGGDHYLQMPMQPIEYILSNDMTYIEGRVTEYMARWRKKGGTEDLKKAQHLIQLMIQFVDEKGRLPNAVKDS